MNDSIFDIYLVNGNITIFFGAHPDEFKNDILNSSLLAELMAAKQSNDRDLSWNSYTDTIRKAGWITNSRDTQRIEFNNACLLRLVQETANSELPDYEQQALVNAFSKLKKLPPGSLPLETLINKLQVNASATGTPMENAPISTAALLTIVRQDKAVITLQIAFKTTSGVAIDILDQPVLKAIKDGKNNCRLLRSSLDGHQYNQIRDTVIAKLGSKIESELLHVQAPIS
ncbi:hypothetical protein [Pseudomonas baetica]|uniref:hypothetical protein n=1 Tax=Pseudomonas baetica TaxID=674054 RepID=UPI0024066D13|nr:hypothetical protein [Pseudomonas baetica]MDF9776538.1 hypothetical protein [Pseudomonas baetica]